MGDQDLADLEVAHSEVVSLLDLMPQSALDRRPEDQRWSLKQILAHVAHAYDFYIMIIEEARAADFTLVRLHPGLAGWERLLATDGAVLACTTVEGVREAVVATHRRAMPLFASLTPAELDHSFVLVESQHADSQPVTTTLRRRVLLTAAEHLREHRAQLTDSLARL